MMDGTPSSTAPDSANSESEIGKLFHWIGDKAHAIWEVLSAEEALLVRKFGPLFQQIEKEAEALAKATLSEGINALFDAATLAVVAAENAGTNKVQAAEAAFLSTVSSEGLAVVSNASAGLIKAAVADFQTARAIAAGSVASSDAPDAPATPAEPPAAPSSAG